MRQLFSYARLVTGFLAAVFFVVIFLVPPGLTFLFFSLFWLSIGLLSLMGKDSHFFQPDIARVLAGFVMLAIGAVGLYPILTGYYSPVVYSAVLEKDESGHTVSFSVPEDLPANADELYLNIHYFIPLGRDGMNLSFETWRPGAQSRAVVSRQTATSSDIVLGSLIKKSPLLHKFEPGDYKVEIRDERGFLSSLLPLEIDIRRTRR